MLLTVDFKRHVRINIIFSFNNNLNNCGYHLIISFKKEIIKYVIIKLHRNITIKDNIKLKSIQAQISRQTLSFTSIDCQVVFIRPYTIISIEKIYSYIINFLETRFQLKVLR